MFAVALFASCTQSVEGVTKEMGAKNRLAPTSFVCEFSTIALPPR